MDDCDSQTGDGDKQIPDPKSPELEITTDTVPAQSLSCCSDSSDFGFIFDDEPDNQIDRDKQIDCGNQLALGAGESQMSSTKSRKRKRSQMSPTWSRKRKRSQMSSPWSRKRKRYEPALLEVYSFFTCPQSPAKTEEPPSPEGHGICTCPQNPAKTEEPPLPEGYGYLPVAPGLDENGRYSPEFTDIIRYMSCSRCGIEGNHWPEFCPNPVNDPPDAASDPASWKYLLGNFDLNKYLEEQRLKVEGKVVNSKSHVSRECTHCRNLSPAETEEPPLPEGYGYLPVAPGLDENGRYSPEFTDIIRYMSCSRCGIEGNHWPEFCPNPVNDLPDAASDPASWKYLLGNFDLNEYLKSGEKPKPTMFQTVCEGNKGLFRPNPWRLIFR